MSAHTPGPWVLDAETCTVDGGLDGDYFVAEVPNNNGLPQNEANARLIAAAPDLLAALKEVSEWINNWAPNFEHDDEWPAARFRIAAAIAKATTP